MQWSKKSPLVLTVFKTDFHIPFLLLIKLFTTNALGHKLSVLAV